MNLLLTDILDCPACMEGDGLILLADRLKGAGIMKDTGVPARPNSLSIREAVPNSGARRPGR